VVVVPVVCCPDRAVFVRSVPVLFLFFYSLCFLSDLEGFWVSRSSDGGYGVVPCTIHGVPILSDGGVALVSFSFRRGSLWGCLCSGAG
ncbi:hypothetical protein A2U01_0066565, partial [Trifolium medium]|nr:hypothetical protein [Trifolium medium]